MKTSGAESGAAVKAKKKKSRLPLVILAVTLIIAGAVVVYLLVGRGGNAEPTDSKPEVMMTQPLNFTVNLADTNRSRFLRVSMVLAYDDRQLPRELATREPEVRDMVISILRSKKVEDLSTAEGTDKLRLQIREALADRLVGVVEVYFTEFLKQ